MPMPADDWNVAEELEYDGFYIRIIYDSCMSPRSFKMGTYLYLAGSNIRTCNELETPIDFGDFKNWDELDSHIKKLYPKCELLPVYRFEHGDVAYNTTGFGDRWDSGRVGFIVMPYEEIQKNCEITRAAKRGDSKSHSGGNRNVTAKVREQARQMLNTEIQEYSYWANGDTYYVEICGSSGIVYDSCGGFYGMDDVEAFYKDWVNSYESAPFRKITLTFE